MNKNIEFEKGQYGTKAIIKTLWQDSFLKLLIDEDVKELELNDGKGWRGENVDFLRFLPNLKSLIIIDLSIKSIEPIHCLIELLDIKLITYSKSSINFNSFPNLINCGFEWIKGSDSLFSCTTLKSLGLNRYNNKSSHELSQLINLEKLTVLNSSIEDLNELTSLKNLKYLSLSNLKNLTSLKGIENLQQIEELEIQRCKGLSIITEIFKLINLKKLLLLDSGDIESIKGIEHLKDLTVFVFYESTNIADGDLSPLLELKHLTKISFQNRKHYTHRREDFGNLYA